MCKNKTITIIPVMKEVFQIWINTNKDMCVEDVNGKFHLYKPIDELSFEQSVISNKPDGFDSYMLMTHEDLLEADISYIGESMIWVSQYFKIGVPKIKAIEGFHQVYFEMEDNFKKGWEIYEIDKGLIRYILPLKKVDDQDLLIKYRESKMESDAEPKIYSN